MKNDGANSSENTQPISCSPEEAEQLILNRVRSFLNTYSLSLRIYAGELTDSAAPVLAKAYDYMKSAEYERASDRRDRAGRIEESLEHLEQTRKLKELRPPYKSPKKMGDGDLFWYDAALLAIAANLSPTPLQLDRATKKMEETQDFSSTDPQLRDTLATARAEARAISDFINNIELIIPEQVTPTDNPKDVDVTKEKKPRKGK